MSFTCCAPWGYIIHNPSVPLDGAAGLRYAARMFTAVRCLVIKIGSSLIVDERGHARKEWLGGLAEDILELHRQGKKVVIVTSGAVALGRHVLQYGLRPLALEEKQAAAAAGQAPLLFQWVQALQALKPAQILLTAGDLKERRRYLNARNTLDMLLSNPAVIPIINENDTVATAELRFGDNDRLAAQVAQMVGADMLIVLSDIDGLYAENPRLNPHATFQPCVAAITPAIEAMAGGTGSAISSGGMTSKIAAAKIATHAGCHMIIMNGHAARPIQRLVQGERHTLFKAKESPLSARKHWIANAIPPAGAIVIDTGAEQALRSGKSLLPAGVMAIEGMFGQGDTVAIKDAQGQRVGIGIIAYGAEDAERIRGKKSQEIERILGFKRRDVLIHRDDMVLK